jgi:uncharacterized protein YdeI (YjbR/CyaY-like superfamily)
MVRKDPRIDAYIAKSASFAKPILKHLRKMVHAGCSDVEETMKWSFPHFMRKGILCSMAAFKQHCSFGFWRGSLIFAKDRGAKAEGAMGQFGWITSLADLPADGVMRGYIREAVRLNDAGVKPPPRLRSKEKKPLVVPAYFRAALKKNRKALTVFENFSYSHKREYVEWITEAKREDTRQRRIEQAIRQMTQGRSRHWKYEKC